MRHVILVTLFILAPLFLEAQHQQPEVFRQFMERVSVKSSIASFFGRGDYGIVGSGIVDFSVMSLSPFSNTRILFSGDLSVFAGAGVGSRYMIGDLARPLNMKTYVAGVSIPLIDFSGFFGLPHPLVVHASPFYENALVRNYKTGNYIGVRGPGVSVSMTAFVTEYLGFFAGISRFKGRQPRSGFVWDTVSETMTFGITLRLGRLLSDQRRTKAAYTGLEEKHNGMVSSLRKVQTERDFLRTEYTSLHDSLVQAGLRLAELLRSKTNEQEEREIRPTIIPVVEHSEHSEYDGNQKAPIQVIRIDKQLFQGTDLVEEDYLKTVLAVISKYSSYVWEIAYRDSSPAESGKGKILAEKIRQFFYIYDSRLRDRLALSPHSVLRPEFEIRCLGIAKDGVSDASNQ